MPVRVPSRQEGREQPVEGLGRTPAQPNHDCCERRVLKITRIVQRSIQIEHDPPEFVKLIEQL